MAVSLSTIAAKDSAGTAIAAGLQAQDKSGAGTGPFTLGQVLIDGKAGTNMLGVFAEDAAHATGDTGLQLLTVRQDTAAALAGTDADYQPLITDSTGRLHVNVSNTVTVASHAVTNAGTFAVQAAITAASGSIGSGAIASGAVASGAFASGAFASGSVASGAIASGAIAAGAIAAGATSIADNEDVASADGDRGVKILAVRKATPANTSGTDGDYEFLQVSAGRLWTNSLIGDGTNTLTLVQDTAGTNVWAVPVMIHPDSSGIISTGTAGSAATAVLTIQGIASMTPVGVSVASAGIASGAIASGAVASGAFASGSVASGAIASGAIAAGAIAAGATSIADNEDVASADGDRGVKVLFKRLDTPANASGTTGDYEQPQMSGGYLWVHDNKGLSNKLFSVAFATLTRPANTTGYAAADSISDNATAGSVTALVSGNISDVNDDPIFISEIHVNSTDTGLAGKKIRAYLFNSDPTASSGVGGGDNAAYSQKKAGYLGSFMGWMETGFSDGTVGRLVPTYNETNFTQAGGFIPALPVSGARTLYIQYQAVEAFTPSGNSTTIIGTAKGWQGRAV